LVAPWQSTAVDYSPSRPWTLRTVYRPVQRLDGRPEFYVVPSEVQDGRTGLCGTLGAAPAEDHAMPEQGNAGVAEVVRAPY